MNGRDLTLGLVALSTVGIAATRFARAGQRNVPADDLANALASATMRIGSAVHPVFAAGTYLQLRALANAVKTGGPEALQQAAKRMAPLVPPGADLIPIPSSSGSTDANRVLADAIAARATEMGTACRVVDALTGDARDSSLKKKRAGEPSLLARQMRTRASPGRHALLGSTRVLLIDNVIATGATARAAAQALNLPGRVGILALAVTSDPSAAARERWATTWKTPLASPWFTRWFGNSKVVTSEGQPLVVWHGHPVNAPAFNAFDFDRAIDLGMHFGTRRAALEFGRGADGKQDTARPFYLAIQRPIRLTDPGDWIAGDWISGATALDQVLARGIFSPEEYAATRERILALQQETRALRRSADAYSTGFQDAYRAAFARYRAEAGRLVRELLERHGYDGVVYENHNEDVGSQSWIAFHPEQIKSAGGPEDAPSDANVGTFDPESPNIHLNRTEKARAPGAPAYPGPTLAPGAPLDAVADAYLTLRHAVPSPVLLRVLQDFATADLDGLPRPGLESFDTSFARRLRDAIAEHTP